MKNYRNNLTTFIKSNINNGTVYINNSRCEHFKNSYKVGEISDYLTIYLINLNQKDFCIKNIFIFFCCNKSYHCQLILKKINFSFQKKKLRLKCFEINKMYILQSNKYCKNIMKYMNDSSYFALNFPSVYSNFHLHFYFMQVLYYLKVTDQKSNKKINCFTDIYYNNCLLNNCRYIKKYLHISVFLGINSIGFHQNYWIYSLHDFTFKKNVMERRVSEENFVKFKNTNSSENVPGSMTKVLKDENGTENIPLRKYEGRTNIINEQNVKNKIFNDNILSVKEKGFPKAERCQQNENYNKPFKNDYFIYAFQGNSGVSYARKPPTIHIPTQFQGTEQNKKDQNQEKENLNKNTLITNKNKIKDVGKKTSDKDKKTTGKLTTGDDFKENKSNIKTTKAIIKYEKQTKRKQNKIDVADINKTQPDKTGPIDTTKKRPDKTGPVNVDKSKLDERDPVGLNKRQPDKSGTFDVKKMLPDKSRQANIDKIQHKDEVDKVIVVDKPKKSTVKKRDEEKIKDKPQKIEPKPKITKPLQRNVESYTTEKYETKKHVSKFSGHEGLKDSIDQIKFKTKKKGFITDFFSENQNFTREKKKAENESTTTEKKKGLVEALLSENESSIGEKKKVQFTDPVKKRGLLDTKKLEYDSDLVKSFCSSQIEQLRNDDSYTDSEFDEMDDEIYEIVLSYANKKKVAISETSLDSKSYSSNLLGEGGILKDILAAFRRQKAQASNVGTSQSRYGLPGAANEFKPKIGIQTFGEPSQSNKLNLKTSYIITFEDVEATLLRDFSPERQSMSEDRCFRIYQTPEPGDQVIIPNAFYSVQEFLNSVGFDPEGPVITDQNVCSKFQICLDVANMYYERLAKYRAILLIHLAMTAPYSVQGYLRQLAESIVNRRINSEDEINGFLNKIHEMSLGVDLGQTNESYKKAELDNFRLIERLKKKIFSEFYRKVGFWEMKHRKQQVSNDHLLLLKSIPKLYKTGLFPFIDFIAEYIASDKIINQDQLEVALSRFLACSDGCITKKEFSDWCTFLPSEEEIKVEKKKTKKTKEKKKDLKTS